MMNNTEIKKAIICKSVKNYSLSTAGIKTYIPQAGDVAIFEVLSIGKHKAIQSANGNNRYLFPGDKIMATFGNRYATNQFEGYVPTQVEDQYQILGQGGCIGVLKSTHAKFDKIGATELKLVAYAVDEGGEVINTRYLTEEPKSFMIGKKRNYEVILSVGSSMDSGKTTSAAYLCRGIHKAGKKVAFIKLTGTVFSKDRRFVKDCGADVAFDFSHLGFPSTYMSSLSEILNIYESLLTKVEEINPDYVVVEIADGLLQRETKMLLHNPAFMSTVSHIMLSCGDSLGVLSGLSFLKDINRTPFAISGLINVSPLLVDECKRSTDIPVLNLSDLESPSVVNSFSRKKELMNGVPVLIQKIA